ncbi:MAG: hypothetical protein IK063_00365 [Clostridia bacterium]|nr:hypothetical protein [Clostridia bacterium]
MNTEEKKTKTLYELGEEYMEQAVILRGQIALLRKRLGALSPLSKEAYRLKSTLSVLYRQRSETVEIAHTLCNYYSTKEAAA